MASTGDSLMPARILFLSDTGGRMGGAAISLASAITRLDRARFEPYAVLGSGGDFADLLISLGVNVTIAELPPIVRDTNPAVHFRNLSNLIRGCRAVLDVCRKNGIDIIHANDNTVLFYAVVPSMICRCASIWHVRSPIRKLGITGRFLARHSTRILSCSESAALPVREQAPKCIDRIRVLYDGVDAQQIEEMSKQDSLRKLHDIPPDVPLAGMIGRISESKGQDVFIRAAVIIREMHPKARFVIAGSAIAGSEQALKADEEYERKARRLVDELGIGDNVIFTGYSKNIPAIVKDLDAVVVPSRQEPLGLVALEAMALGVPVVASNVGGLCESITDKFNGLLVPPDAPGALALAISKLWQDKQLVERLTANGRQTVREKFSADAHAAALQAIYDEIAVK